MKLFFALLFVLASNPVFAKSLFKREIIIDSSARMEKEIWTITAGVLKGSKIRAIALCESALKLAQEHPLPAGNTNAVQIIILAVELDEYQRKSSKQSEVIFDMNMPFQDLKEAKQSTDCDKWKPKIASTIK